MKKIPATIFAALALSISHAQIMTGPSAGERAIDRARTGPITPAHTHSGVEPSAVEPDEPEARWWALNASTGWDSLYMDRGVNVLGNGNGLYWLTLAVELSVWEGGSLTPGFWYGVGSHWTRANTVQAYKECLVFVDFTQQFGPLSVSTGWEYTYAPMNFEAQNEIYAGLAYDWSLGPVTITPNTAWYCNLGPELGTPGGTINGGASYWILAINADIPVAHDGAVCLAPWTAFGVNFGFNDRGGDPLLGIDGERFIGGNNVEFGVAAPIQLTEHLNISPYVACSCTWQSLGAGEGSGTGFTAPVTWWAGLSANFSY